MQQILRVLCVATLGAGLTGASTRAVLSSPQALARPAGPARTTAATGTDLQAAYGKLPMRFELNQGQAPSGVRFVARGQGYTLLLTSGSAELALAKPATWPASRAARTQTVTLRLLGANTKPAVVGLDRLPGSSNYLIGADPRHWYAAVPVYARVAYRGVYKGIDLVYHGSGQKLEYDFDVASGANPQQIVLGVDGAQRLQLVRGGDLLVHFSGGDLVQQRPVVYQVIDGQRRPVAARYNVHGTMVGFTLGRYDTRRPLVIDPVYSYGTYLGGTGDQSGNGIAVDANGNAYVVGYTSSNNLPIVNAYQVRNRASGYGQNVFIAKFNATGTGLLYTTYLGGNGVDTGSAIAVDASGNAYITGNTTSNNFPVVNAIQVRKAGSGSAAFVAKLGPGGNSLLYSTYLGSARRGYSNSGGRGIAVDSSGSAYVTGYTNDKNFPVRNALQPMCGSCTAQQEDQQNDAFVARLSPSGTTLDFSTFLGGDGNDIGNAIAVDATRNIFVAGTTGSTNFPNATALGGTAGGDSDGFVVRIKPDGTSLVYSTLLGGNDKDEALGIAVDNARNAYVTGYTTSSNFPTTAHAFQATYAGGARDAFVAKINPAGTTLLYSTLLGGNDDEVAYGIAVDAAGEAYVTGKTASSNFPVTRGALQSAPAGGQLDAFVTKLNAAGSALVYSTYLGGGDVDEGYAIALDSAGSAYVTGQTHSSDFPTSLGAFSNTALGTENSVFVAKLGNVAAPLVGGILPNLAPPSKAPGAVYVPDTNHSVAAPFVPAYRRTDPLVLGHPVDEAYVHNGVLTQDFDHMRLELRNGTVVAGNLGSEVFSLQSRHDPRLLVAARAVPATPSTKTSLYFPQTGHRLQGDLLVFWQAHGGMAVFGAPISEVVRDSNGDGSGRTYEMQWFQNARIERHPENAANLRYAILLGLLGPQSLREKGWVI